MAARLYPEGPAEYGYAVIFDDRERKDGYLFLRCPGRDPWQEFDPRRPKPNLRKCRWVLREDDAEKRRWFTLRAAKRALKARTVRV